MSFKWWLVVAASIFIFGMVLGLTMPADSASLVAEDIAFIEYMAGILATLPDWLVAVLIFAKNTSALLISLVFSPFFCLTPVLALVLNGLILGLVSVIVLEEASFGYLIAAILPHGILELPAFIIGEAVALSSGTALILALFSRERRKVLLPVLVRNLRFLAIAVVLLLPAAVIETYVTPLLLK